jgi:hypothetical protein
MSLCELYPGICLETEENARKNRSQGSQRGKMHEHMIFIFSFSYSQCEFNTYCKVVNTLYILYIELTTFIYITLLSNIFIHYFKLLNVFRAEFL